MKFLGFSLRFLGGYQFPADRDQSFAGALVNGLIEGRHVLEEHPKRYQHLTGLVGEGRSPGLPCVLGGCLGHFFNYLIRRHGCSLLG